MVGMINTTKQTFKLLTKVHTFVNPLVQLFMNLSNAAMPKKDDIENALSGITANDLKSHSMNSIETIRQQNCTHLILKSCHDSNPVVMLTFLSAFVGFPSILSSPSNILLYNGFFLVKGSSGGR